MEKEVFTLHSPVAKDKLLTSNTKEVVSLFKHKTAEPTGLQNSA